MWLMSTSDRMTMAAGPKPTIRAASIVQNNVTDVHTAYVENVAEGADAEQVIRSLARKGFDVIFTTSFGFMDASEIVANEFPDVDIIHVSGFKANDENFGNLMGSMENMKYVAGMVAGARAKADGNPKLGYIATFPIPEELRLGNAFALGAQQTCPECTIDVRWIFTWHDPILEKEAASSLFDSGVQVVMTGADTPGPGRGRARRQVGHHLRLSIQLHQPACLTSMYWNWGPVYTNIVEAVPQWQVCGRLGVLRKRHRRHGSLRFRRRMRNCMPGVASLPEADLALISGDLRRSSWQVNWIGSTSSPAPSPTTRATWYWRRARA